MTLVCVMAAAEGQSGWDAVAGDLLLGEPKPKARRGRPPKERHPAGPGPGSAVGPPTDDRVRAPLANIAEALLTHCHSTMSSIGSFLQRRLWSGLKEGSQAEGRPANDNPATFLLQKMPVISVAGHAFSGNISGSKQTLSRDERRVGCCSLHFAGHLAGLFLQQCANFTAQGWQVLAVYKRRRYDETPTKIAIKESQTPETGDQHAKTEVAKIFQTELCIGVLMCHATKQRCSLMKVSLPTMMSCVDTASAANIKRALRLIIVSCMSVCPCRSRSGFPWPYSGP